MRTPMPLPVLLCSNRIWIQAAARSQRSSLSGGHCAPVTRLLPAVVGVVFVQCSMNTANRSPRQDHRCQLRCSVSTMFHWPVTNSVWHPMTRLPVPSPRHERAGVVRQTCRTRRCSQAVRLEDIFAMVQRGEVATLNLILKSDVQGSLEALTEALRKVDAEHDEVRLSFVHRAVGGITESDINLAAVSNATVIGFNVRPDRKAREAADYNKVEMRLYEVIYGVLEDVNSALVGMLAPEFQEVVTGDAEVREVFSVPRAGKIAGCFVRNGVITRGSKVRFLREGVVIWNGSISSLKRFKEDAREVREGFECGIGLENYSDLKPGDVIETYELKEVARTA